jgi:hypothetical protein
MSTTLIGANFTGYATSAKGNQTFQAFSPAANSFLDDKFSLATEAELEHVLQLAEKAFPVYRNLSATDEQIF